ncbi:AMP-binding protein [Vibrio tapetis]|uniref:Putative Acetyl-CoA synthetase-like n=1 Tax=Vibrio tapetis subsp. tapetis TaxID=1671868 RepID=A0A2N8ZB63_9VIBR|nr:AMP-binding protein [Vibrio tapetis]SON49123.1 putative Acetyl-CoA synthetase-like [Vibrio tapetis subsp. tapetis]
MSSTIKKIWQNFNRLGDHYEALWVNNKSYSYRDLATRSQKVNLNLKACSAHQKTVAVLATRSVDTYSALLGTLFSGNIFLPLSPKQPEQRLVDILHAAHCDLIIASPCDRDLIDRLLQALPLLQIIWQTEHPNDQENGSVMKINDEAENVDIATGGYAYLMFTSGTTGTPKGIGITHQNLDQYINHMDSCFEFNSDDKFSQHSDLTFDLSVHDWALSWSHGAALYVLPELLKSCPVDFIRFHGITSMLAVPNIIPLSAQLNKLEKNSIPSLRHSFFCGQALSVDHASQWAQATNRKLVNLYGPTEATIAISAHEFNLQKDYQAPYVPIGSMFKGQTSRLVPIAHSDCARLYIQGEQVINHYWHNAIADKLAFQQDSQGEIWYDTGDIVTVNENGLNYKGRQDHQVKVQGHRIELGEIESTVRQLGFESAAVPWPINEHGEAIGLVLYVIETSKTNRPAIEKHLRMKLPNYMIPSSIHFCQRLPININGKVDLKDLQTQLNKLSGKTHDPSIH